MLRLETTIQKNWDFLLSSEQQSNLNYQTREGGRIKCPKLFLLKNRSKIVKLILVLTKICLGMVRKEVGKVSLGFRTFDLFSLNQYWPIILYTLIFLTFDPDPHEAFLFRPKTTSYNSQHLIHPFSQNLLNKVYFFISRKIIIQYSKRY